MPYFVSSIIYIFFNSFVIVRSLICFVRSSPNNKSVGLLVAKHEDLFSGFREDLISSCLYNERS